MVESFENYVKFDQDRLNLINDAVPVVKALIDAFAGALNAAGLATAQNAIYVSPVVASDADKISAEFFVQNNRDWTFDHIYDDEGIYDESGPRLISSKKEIATYSIKIGARLEELEQPSSIFSLSRLFSEKSKNEPSHLVPVIGIKRKYAPEHKTDFGLFGEHSFAVLNLDNLLDNAPLDEMFQRIYTTAPEIVRLKADIISVLNLSRNRAPEELKPL